MEEPVLNRIAARVAAIRSRHLVIALLAGLAGLGALGLDAVLGDADAPIGARVFFCVGGLATAGWQLWLAAKIGRGLGALRAARTVTWVYALHASINGAHVGSSVMIGLDGGERLELPLDVDADPRTVIESLARAHPRATIGFDAATDARFVADPRSLLRS